MTMWKAVRPVCPLQGMFNKNISVDQNTVEILLEHMYLIYKIQLKLKSRVLNI